MADTRLLLTLSIVFVAAVGGAKADQLADVKARGTLTCGVLGTFEPFGYTDVVKRTVAGYDVEFCEAIAKRLGVTAEPKVVSNEARIPELQQGRIDLVVAGLGYSPARSEQVDFSDGYYVSKHKLTVRTDSGFATRDDLSGHRISFTKGGITESFVRKTVPDVTMVGFEDTPTAFAALVQGKYDAFSVSEVAASRLISKLGPAPPSLRSSSRPSARRSGASA